MALDLFDAGHPTSFSRVSQLSPPAEGIMRELADDLSPAIDGSRAENVVPHHRCTDALNTDQGGRTR
ncbi:hypothetical protein [Microbacterium sp. B35-30]|uniref:hypothetical protein n=1 Tax=Microbacterium sp. B35-30 TaxID=1962642 RepID=UPI0013D0D539|nr:hypothetical protein [Microbacterium sp. B35-30]